MGFLHPGAIGSGAEDFIQAGMQQITVLGIVLDILDRHPRLAGLNPLDRLSDAQSVHGASCSDRRFSGSWPALYSMFSGGRALASSSSRSI